MTCSLTLCGRKRRELWAYCSSGWERFHAVINRNAIKTASDWRSLKETFQDNTQHRRLPPAC